ncbi:hypothetical protein SKAU_G00294040 [Synaphobranchus kaupii]|uniref:Epithelial membrane protein 1 n=1 Tax=Synaphobranchus kaupii TaxID=118154 RepID=A0A9Q1EUC4_SYNKA|nr:hypothetical protein SKAU_G00294040 [Synaphobranchus kaupii]
MQLFELDLRSGRCTGQVWRMSKQAPWSLRPVPQGIVSSPGFETGQQHQLGRGGVKDSNRAQLTSLFTYTDLSVAYFYFIIVFQPALKAISEGPRVNQAHFSAVTMLVLLGGIFLLHITTIIILLVATIDNAWWFTENISTDIWARWLKTNDVWNYTDIPSTYPQDYLQAVQATSVLSCIFSILGLFVFVAQLFTLAKGQRFTFSGIFQFIACLCIMIAASIYTDIFHRNEKDGWYGHSYVLAWIAFVFTFISSIIYFVLRKKTA